MSSSTTATTTAVTTATTTSSRQDRLNENCRHATLSTSSKKPNGRNAFRYYMLYLNMYMVDVLFNLQDEEAKHELILPSRVDTAYLVAVAYLLPTLVLHVWDIMRAVMDVEGRLQVLLKSYLFRRYLNYSPLAANSTCALGTPGFQVGTVLHVLRRGISSIRSSTRHAGCVGCGRGGRSQRLRPCHASLSAGGTAPGQQMKQEVLFFLGNILPSNTAVARRTAPM